MTISYKDYNEEDARAKLNALVKTVEKFSNEMVEVKTVDQNGNEIVKYEKKFFKANISIVPMYEAECLRGSDTKKIVIIAVVLSIVAAFLYALFMYMVADKVNSEERLETITGRKNLISINKKKAEDDAVSLDLRKLSDTLIYIGDEKYRVYQIQSTMSGEGKTSLTVNLAKSLGESRRKTLIIDCDFYNPAPQIVLGRNARSIITGNRFKAYTNAAVRRISCCLSFPPTILPSPFAVCVTFSCMPTGRRSRLPKLSVSRRKLSASRKNWKRHVPRRTPYWVRGRMKAVSSRPRNRARKRRCSS